MKIPTSLAQCADLYYKTRAKRLLEQKKLKPLQELEAALSRHLVNNLPKSKASGIAGKVARAQVKSRYVPVLNDEEALMRFAKRRGNDDLIKHSLVASAVEARWEAGKQVPGVGRFKVISVSVTSIK